MAAEPTLAAPRRLWRQQRSFAVARAKASEDGALIAQQKLRIAKLERRIYGQRSERSSRLIDQLALTFEELQAEATEDELAAERLSPRRRLCADLRARAPSARRSPSISTRTSDNRSADELRVLRQQSPAQTRRRRDPDAGIVTASVESDRDGAGEVQLP